MKPNSAFTKLPKAFWANVRSLSQKLGYTNDSGQISVPTLSEMRAGYRELELSSSHVADRDNNLTRLGETLLAYFQHRAKVLNESVEPRLMDKAKAEKEYEKLYRELKPKCPIPMNKQKGDKKAPAYLTGIVNMLVEKHCGAFGCDYDPRRLTTVTRDKIPLRTFARRVDGAFPTAINPVAVWEIKEYYYTTTFGSRVADGVYESLLDGMELEEVREHEGIDIKHYLMVDDHFTWWSCGRSYLCRLVDMLHMGYVDEILFGSEVIEELPKLVKSWVSIAKSRSDR
jgi:hypothetical protein